MTPREPADLGAGVRAIVCGPRGRGSKAAGQKRDQARRFDGDEERLILEDIRRQAARRQAMEADPLGPTRAANLAATLLDGGRKP